MCTDFIIDSENLTKVFLCVEILPLLFFSCTYEGVSDIPFLRNPFACGILEEEEVEEKKKDRNAVHSSREVFL